MSRDRVPIEVVRRAFGLLAGRTECLRFFSDGVFVSAGDRFWSGRGELADWRRATLAPLADPCFDVAHASERGGDVLILLVLRGTDRSSGAPVEIEMPQIWTVRDGLVSAVEMQQPCLIQERLRRRSSLPALAR